MLIQYYYFAIKIVSRKYLGINSHIDDTSAKLSISAILLEQFGSQRVLQLSTTETYFMYEYLKSLFT